MILEIPLSMNDKKKRIVALSGSIRKESLNLQILNYIAQQMAQYSSQIEFEIYEGMDKLPYFNPDLNNAQNLPQEVAVFRNEIAYSDAVVICTPEYVFSLPACLKNALEWTVSTTVFSDKPVALVTAAASGVKAQKALSLIMKTIGAKVSRKADILIQAPKAKVSKEGVVLDEKTKGELEQLMSSLGKQLNL